MTHSFYATMGGFVMKTDQEGQDPYIPGSPRLHLLPDGIVALAKMDLLPSISKEYILDKSNADILAKLIVIAQSSWFILQMLTRWAMGLPVTPLELTTVSHAVCAIASYCLWWDKPLDIHDPTIVEGEWVPPVAALMWMSSRVSSRRMASGIFGHASRPYPECQDIYWIDDPTILQNVIPMYPGAQNEDSMSKSASTDHVELLDLSSGTQLYRKLLPGGEQRYVPLYMFTAGESVILKES